ncbi:helix-turn-helix transcriptional regulator [Streptacidiphilus sp. N1-10]|uniref:Helix-turn-helix transcriptional regulator n=1 Tax=Streptacidiphilus jeojiensis TaxID=3229225 RepID=A0ABV6XEZ0_9ACTN
MSPGPAAPQPGSPGAVRAELAAFLKSRRARLRPEDVDLPLYGGRRRVAGLRREELAMLAGVSVTHYTRLEQGRGDGASDSVLDAIAGALRLSDDERAHLKDLARPAGEVRRSPQRAGERPTSAVRHLLTAMSEAPAVVLNRRNDVLAWNRLGHALLAGHLDFDAPDRSADRPNLTDILFLSPQGRALYPRWDEEAQLAVASLRLVAGRHPQDRRLGELVGRLAVQSQDFAALWAHHPVRTCSDGVKQLDHPTVGTMELFFQSMSLTGSADQRMIAYSAEPGTPSEAALRLLASLSRSGSTAEAETEAEAVD